ncbi:MAG: hypothetical protein QOK17_1557 [Sphingomonadales bacterium]|jgi:hypothetical protein|nr:hypothetical protein [Sphingomonadales bacterium]
MNRLVVMAAAAMLVAGGAGALAKPSRPDASPRQRPEAFEALVRCRSVADERQRLACYDGAAAALEQAADRHDLVVVDRKQVRETKRTLFGLELPSLSIFGGGNDEGDEVKEVEGVVQSAFQDGNGRWVVTLADGATWAQIDNQVVAVRPKAGQKVKIHRGAIGSYIMNVNGQPGVKARRQL